MAKVRFVKKKPNSKVIGKVRLVKKTPTKNKFPNERQKKGRQMRNLIIPPVA